MKWVPKPKVKLTHIHFGTFRASNVLHSTFDIGFAYNSVNKKAYIYLTRIPTNEIYFIDMRRPTYFTQNSVNSKLSAKEVSSFNKILNFKFNEFLKDLSDEAKRKNKLYISLLERGVTDNMTIWEAMVQLYNFYSSKDGKLSTYLEKPDYKLMVK